MCYHGTKIARFLDLRPSQSQIELANPPSIQCRLAEKVPSGPGFKSKVKELLVPRMQKDRNNFTIPNVVDSYNFESFVAMQIEGVSAVNNNRISIYSKFVQTEWYPSTRRAH